MLEVGRNIDTSELTGRIKETNGTNFIKMQY